MTLPAAPPARRSHERRRSPAAPRGRVLVVEDEAYVRESLTEILRERGYDVVEAGTVEEALRVVAQAPVDVVLTDFRLPGADGLELVRQVQAAAADLPVVVLTGQGTIASAVECLKSGASDYLLKPADPEALEVALERAVAGRALRREVRYLRTATGREVEPIGESPAWRQAIAMVDAAAPTDSVVLLRGESGTGKDLLARRLHQQSRRSARPVRRRELRRRPPRAVGERVLRPSPGRRSPAPAPTARAGSSSPTAAPSSSTRWARSPRPPRPSCCARSRTASSTAWASSSRRASTCASWPPPTRDLEADIKEAASAPTSTTG